MGMITNRSPQTVNHARNCGQQLDQIFQQQLKTIRKLAPDWMKMKIDRLENS